jgi:uncharacterized protein (TIGR03437 family)
VNSGWSGTATPSKAGFSFAPPSATYSSVTSNQTQNYIGTVVVPVLTTVSAASFLRDAPLAPSSIAAGFGQGLVAAMEVAPPDPPLPTALAGVSVKVRDSAGTERPALLWFVSPEQINFYIPDGTRTGAATVSVERQGQAVATGALPIEPVAPALFSMNANGQGVAAGIAVHAKPDGSQSWEYVFVLGCAVGSCVAKPIDLGPESEQVVLQLYGTAIRGRSLLAAVSATIGGVNAPVEYAGAVAGFTGLDQVNLRVPRGLMGRGEVNIVLTADGRASNTVTVSIK